MKLIVIAVALIMPFSIVAQDLDTAAFKNDIQQLYQAGMKTLKPLIDGEATASNGGENSFASTLKLSGAESVIITVDEEGSHTYTASYTFKNVRDPKAKTEEMANLIVEATAEYGLDKSMRTDIAYVGYQKHVIEFPADNIDDMGKHTSFAVGLTKDGNPMSLEIIVSEILWK